MRPHRNASRPAAAALIDEACGIRGNLLTHGAGTSPDDHVVYLHRICYRGERWPDAERSYFKEYFARDERVPRLRVLPDGRLAHAADFKGTLLLAAASGPRPVAAENQVECPVTIPAQAPHFPKQVSALRLPDGADRKQFTDTP